MKSNTITAAFLSMLILTLLCLGTFAYGQETVSPFSGTSIRELVKMVVSADRNTQGMISDEIISRRKEAIPVLRSILHEGTVAEIRYAVTLLGTMRDKGAAPELIELTKSQDVDISSRTFKALRDIKAVESLPRLREILAMKSFSQSGLSSAIVAVGFLGDKNDISLLVPYLVHSNPVVKFAAAAMIGNLGGTEGKSLVLDKLNGSELAERGHAIQAASFLNDPETEKKLVELSEYESRSQSEARKYLTMRRIRTIDSQKERITSLLQLSQDSDHTLANWALESLADMETDESRAVLKEISQGQGKAAMEAGRLLKLRGE